MAATVELKIYTGSGGTENPSSGDASNWNLMSIDSYDSTGTDYQNNPITVPASGTNYSYERWMRLRFSGSFNLIDNIKAWKSAGTLSDANLTLNAGVTDTYAQPVNSASTIATSAIPESEATALDLTPSGGVTSSPGYSKYLVVQLVVPSSVTTPGDIGNQTITFQYDES